jgi:hypothetical protein
MKKISEQTGGTCIMLRSADHRGISFDNIVTKMTNLVELDCTHQISWSRRTIFISNNSISRLTQLNSLSVSCNSIQDSGMKLLTNLTSLKLYDTHKRKLAPETITDESLVLLTNLRNLRVSDTKQITNKGISELHNLISLDLSDNTFSSKINNEGIKNLTKLISLSLNRNITEDGMKNLTNLTYLQLYEYGRGISNEGLNGLTNLLTLQSISQVFNKCFPDNIKVLSHITTLITNTITEDEELEYFYSLIYLSLSCTANTNINFIDFNMTGIGVSRLFNLRKITLTSFLIINSKYLIYNI